MNIVNICKHVSMAVDRFISEIAATTSPGWYLMSTQKVKIFQNTLPKENFFANRSNLTLLY